MFLVFSRWIDARIILALCIASYWSIMIVSMSAAREPWTTSRLVGSPEPPLPTKLVPAFPKLEFDNADLIAWQPAAARYFVGDLQGKVWTFPHDETVDHADLLVDLKADLKTIDRERFEGFGELYGMALDPDFALNRFIYLCWTMKPKNGARPEDGTRVSRFHVTEENPPKLDLSSELPIISWVVGGHNGSDLAFDTAGNLLISTGDASDPSPPDRLATGQDCSDLLSSILRIDVRGATRERPYLIPEDNPFRQMEKIRPEVWAFGFRNPWRISVDPESKQLWLGDVGWEQWEMVHRVERGGNYGWSVREGFDLLLPDARIGPSPISPPQAALPHSEAASITGGFVYRGNAIPELKGHYLFGDWVVGGIWSIPIEGPNEYRKIAEDKLRIVAFGKDRDGEPLVANHQENSTLYRLIKNPNYEAELAQSRSFPKRLSETGLLTGSRSNPKDPIPYRLQSGVEPFTINQPMWMDGADALYHIALPGDSSVRAYVDPKPLPGIAMFGGRMHFPPGAVLMKTICLPSRSSIGVSRKAVETQVLLYDGRLWNGFSYLWNSEGTDAELVPAGGVEITLPVPDKTSDTTQLRTWRVHSRTECLQCHNPWPESTLAFRPEQLHRGGLASEWMRLAAGGWVKTLGNDEKSVPPEACAKFVLSVKGDNEHEPLDKQARSYLAVNCSHCHMFGAGGSVEMSLRFTDTPEQLKAIGVPPAKGSFNIADAAIIQPGHPDQSILMVRMATAAVGRMPHIGSRVVDAEGVTVVAHWIRELKRDSEQPSAASHPASLSSQALVQLNASPDTQKALAAVLALCAHDVDQTGSKKMSDDVKLAIRDLAESKDPITAGLFEALVPESERRPRMGIRPRIEMLGGLDTDAKAGEKMFHEASGLQCAKCHRVAGRGGEIGPDLSTIADKLTRKQLFESLIDPSRSIDPKFQSTVIVTEDGRALTGLIVDDSRGEVRLRTAQGESVVVASQDIAVRKLDSKSLMPTGLISELTPQQAADLLAYLESLKKR